MLKFESNDETVALRALRNVPREATAVRVLVPMHAIQADEVLPPALRMRDGRPQRAEASRSWSVRGLFAVDANVTREEFAAPGSVPPPAPPTRVEQAPARQAARPQAGNRARTPRTSQSVFTRLYRGLHHWCARLAGPEHAAVVLRQQRVRDRQACRAF